MRNESMRPIQVTSADLIRAAATGARLLVRRWRNLGLGEEAIRRQVIDEYRRILAPDEGDIFLHETLMASVQRATERELVAGE